MSPDRAEAAAPAPWRPRAWRLLGRAAFLALYRCRIVGGEHLPRTGPVVLVVNHTGFLDGALVLALAPRPAHFLVLDRSFTGVVGRLLRWSGQIPLDQRTGDRRALGQALEVLGRGGVVGIFPEGGRGRGDLASAGKGAAWLALRSGATVVPVACLGTRATGALAASWPRLRSRLVVDLGAPLDLAVPPGLPGRAALDLATERLRSAHADHVVAAAERHGIPLPTDVPPDLLE